MKKKQLVHHHFLYYAVIWRTVTHVEDSTRMLLEGFLSDLVGFLHIGEWWEQKISYDEKFTIRTGKMMSSISHAIFHFYQNEWTVQVDLYSMKPYDINLIKEFCNIFRLPQKLDFLSIQKQTPEHTTGH